MKLHKIRRGLTCLVALLLLLQIGGLLVVGCISPIAMQVFLNVGVVTALLPNTGISLPFFSYGGSSLWGFTILLFILLRLDAARVNKLQG